MISATTPRGHERFWVTHYFRLHGRSDVYPEDACSTFLRNFGDGVLTPKTTIWILKSRKAPDRWSIGAQATVNNYFKSVHSVRCSDQCSQFTDPTECTLLFTYDTICYLLTTIGFPPGGSGPYSCIQIEKKQLYTQGDAIHTTIQKQRTHKIEMKTYKIIEANMRRIIKI
jgi:hypothetical protein